MIISNFASAKTIKKTCKTANLGWVPSLNFNEPLYTCKHYEHETSKISEFKRVSLLSMIEEKTGELLRLEQANSITYISLNTLKEGPH